jgi:hypothetical protein
MRYAFTLPDDINEFATAGLSRPMTVGEHVCQVADVGEPRTKMTDVWFEGRLVAIETREVMVQFADINDPSQTVRAYFRLPSDLPWPAERYFRGTSKERDKFLNFHVRNVSFFIEKLGFWREGSNFPDEAWDPASWVGLDVALTVQVQKPRPSVASETMAGVEEAQQERTEIKLFSYRLTPAGLRRQADRVRSVAPTLSVDEVPF